MPKDTKAPAKEPLVCAIAYDGLCTFEFGIAVELFALARPEFDRWYRYATVKADTGPIRATGGLTIEAEDDLSNLEGASLIIVPGWRGAETPVPEHLINALRKAHSNGARIASICSGVFVLAATGLLNGHRATTHWRYTDTLARMYPEITVDPDVLFVQADRVFFLCRLCRRPRSGPAHHPSGLRRTGCGHRRTAPRSACPTRWRPAPVCAAPRPNPASGFQPRRPSGPNPHHA